jgi:DNA-binding MarR family transcriptional regulator
VSNDEAAANAERRAITQRMIHVLPRFAMLVDATREFDTPHGPVGFRQAAVLYLLRYHLIPVDAVSPSMLAEYYNIKPSVVTRVLAKLEDHGFIERRPNQSDGRSFHVDITEKGREVSIHIEELYLDWMRDGIAFIDDHELAEFRETLERLNTLADRLGAGRRHRQHPTHF